MKKFSKQIRSVLLAVLTIFAVSGVGVAHAASQVEYTLQSALNNVLTHQLIQRLGFVHQVACKDIRGQVSTLSEQTKGYLDTMTAAQTIATNCIKQNTSDHSTVCARETATFRNLAEVVSHLTNALASLNKYQKGLCE